MGRHRVGVRIADAQQSEQRLAQSGDERSLSGRRTRADSRQAVERGRTTCGGVGEQQVRREQRGIGHNGDHAVLTERADVDAAEPFAEHCLATVLRHKLPGRRHKRDDLPVSGGD